MTEGPIVGAQYQRLEVRGADYLVACAGDGPPVLLLHGFPETHYCWRRVVPALARRHSVIAPDLRGYGGTVAPPGGPEGQGYTKRELAADLVKLMASLGYGEFAVAGHDRGGRVAYRMALDRPESVTRLAVLNIVPTIEQFERMGSGPLLGYWPWFLLAQPAPFPERLIGAAPQHLLHYVFESWTSRADAIDETARDEYVRALDDGTIAAMCADFRASFWLDQEDDAADRSAGRQIECPLLVAVGADEPQLADAAEVWRRWARDVRAITVPGGHFNPEEAPEAVSRALSDFLAAS